MLRYCTNCRKEYDFEVKSLEELDNLICPVCGAHVDQRSKSPEKTYYNEAPARVIGYGLWQISVIRYYFYPVCAILGALSFFLHWDTALYIVTGISLVLFVLDYFFSAFLVLPVIGGVAGFLLLHSVRGACFGVMCAWALLYLIRLVRWFIISKLIEAGNR